MYAVTSEELDVDSRFVTIEESPNPVIQWPFRTSLIHAPTGAVIYQFREVLNGRTTSTASSNRCSPGDKTSSTHSGQFGLRRLGE